MKYISFLLLIPSIFLRPCAWRKSANVFAFPANSADIYTFPSHPPPPSATSPQTPPPSPPPTSLLFLVHLHI